MRQRLKIAVGLEGVGLGLIAALPLILPFAGSSASAILLTAAIFLVGAFVFENSWDALAARAMRAMGPCFWLGVLFFAWAVLSFLWSLKPSRGLQELENGLFPALTTFALFVARPAKIPRWFPLALATAFALGCCSVVIEARLSFPIRSLYDKNLEPWRLNIVVVALVVLFWSIARLATGWKVPVFLGVLLVVAIASSISATARWGFAFGLVAWVAAYALPVFTRWWLTPMFVLALFSIFFEGELLTAILDPQRVSWLKESAFERVHIWQAFKGIIIDGLPWGYGLGSVLLVELTTFFKTADAQTQHWLSYGHPHNHFAEIWFCLGLPGALIVTEIFRRGVQATQNLFAENKAFVCAMIAQTLFMSLVSHGLWQAWWWSAVGLGFWLNAIATDTKAVQSSAQ